MRCTPILDQTYPDHEKIFYAKRPWLLKVRAVSIIGIAGFLNQGDINTVNQRRVFKDSFG